MADSAGRRDAVATQPYEPEEGAGRAARKRKKWDEAEVEALTLGVEEYGEGHWRDIKDDEEYGPILRNRDNVQLKDKWRNIEKKGFKPEMAKVTGEEELTAAPATATASVPVPVLSSAEIDDADVGIPDDPRPFEILRSRLPQILCDLHGINSELRECANVLPLQRTLQRSGALEKSLKQACELAGIDVDAAVGRPKKKKRRRRKPPSESPGGVHFQLNPFRTQEAAGGTPDESESDDEEDGEKQTGEDTSEKSSGSAKADGADEVEEEDFSPMQTRAQRRGAKPPREGSFSKILKSLGIR